MRDEVRDVFVNGHRLEGGIYTAVEEWCLERTAAKKKYGPIASWDTSEITNMEYLFYRKADMSGKASNQVRKPSTGGSTLAKSSFCTRFRRSASGRIWSGR